MCAIREIDTLQRMSGAARFDRPAQATVPGVDQSAFGAYGPTLCRIKKLDVK